MTDEELRAALERAYDLGAAAARYGVEEPALREMEIDGLMDELKEVMPDEAP